MSGPGGALKAPPTRYVGAIQSERSTPSLHHAITPRAGFEDEDEDDDENEAPYAGFIATATNRFAFTS
jgi:hypothetical protein